MTSIRLSLVLLLAVAASATQAPPPAPTPAGERTSTVGPGDNTPVEYDTYWPGSLLKLTCLAQAPYTFKPKTAKVVAGKWKKDSEVVFLSTYGKNDRGMHQGKFSGGLIPPADTKTKGTDPEWRLTASATFAEIISITIQSARANGDPGRLKVGVGELVRLKTTNGSAATWTIAPKDPVKAGTLTTDDGPLTIWTAPERGHSVTITGKIKPNGPSKAFKFTVTEPTGYQATKDSDKSYPAGTIAVGMVIKPMVLLPDDVSFYRVETREGECAPAGATGCFGAQGTLQAPRHDGANLTGWQDIDPRNEGNTDEAYLEIGPDSTNVQQGGSFTWPIPDFFQIESGAQGEKKFATSPQAFTVTATGAMTVGKFGLSAYRAP